MVEKLHGAVRVGGDSSDFGVEGFLFHLEGGQIRVVVDAALSEEGDIFEAVVTLDNMMEIGMSFAADIFQGFDIEVELWRVLGAAFGVDLTVFEDRFEPGEVFVVMSHDNLKVYGVEALSRGSF